MAGFTRERINRKATLHPILTTTSEGKFAGYHQLILQEGVDLAAEILEDLQVELIQMMKAGNEDLRVDVGVLHDLMGNRKNAKQELELAAAQSDEDAHYPLGRIYVEEKTRNQAAQEVSLENEKSEEEISWNAVVNHLKKATDINSGNSAAFFFLGKALEKLVETESLKHAADAYTHYINAEAPIGFLDEATAFIQKQDPERKKKALMEQGTLALEKGETEESIQAFQEAIQLGVGIEAFMNLAKAYEQGHNLPRTVDTYLEAMKSSENKEELSLLLGKSIHALFGDLDLAKKGIEMLPDSDVGEVTGESPPALKEELQKTINVIGAVRNKWVRVRSWEGNAPYSSATFAPDGQTILSADHNTARLWRVTGEELVQYNGHSDVIQSIAFAPDGQKILTASKDTTAIIWNLNGEKIETFPSQQEPIHSATYSADEQFVLFVVGADKVRRFHLESGTITDRFDIQKGETQSPVTYAAFHPNAQQILSCGKDGTAIVWDESEDQAKETMWRKVQAFAGHQSGLTHACFSPDGDLLLTSSEDGSAKLWKSTGIEHQSFNGHTETVTTVDFAPNHSRILTGSRDRSVRFWNLDGQTLQQIQLASEVLSANYSPDGKYILITTPESVQLWENPDSLWEKLLAERNNS
ncbi:MAG: hypothetical protein AAF587_42585 [Bacteroidota bacterium]